MRLHPLVEQLRETRINQAWIQEERAHEQTAAILVRKWIVRMDGETSETRSLLSVFRGCRYR